MPRQNITHLRRSALPKPYRRGLRKLASAAQFETKEAMIKEDTKRARCLRKNRKECKVPNLGRRSAKQLQKALEYSLDHGTILNSAASALYMRSVRKKLVAWLRYLYLSEPQDIWDGTINPAFVTIMPRSSQWVIPGDQLPNVDARKLIEQLRVDLTRESGTPQQGWAFFGLHGEYCTDTDMWHIHAHGLVAGEMLGRCMALRTKGKKNKKYRSNRLGRGPAAERGSTPVVIEQLPPNDLWRQAAYRFQSFWPVAGRVRRNRIPEPRHSQWLLWIDRSTGRRSLPVDRSIGSEWSPD